MAIVIKLRFNALELSAFNPEHKPFAGQEALYGPLFDLADWTVAEIRANDRWAELERGEWLDTHHALSLAECLAQASRIDYYDLCVTPIR